MTLTICEYDLASDDVGIYEDYDEWLKHFMINEDEDIEPVVSYPV